MIRLPEKWGAEEAELEFILKSGVSWNIAHTRQSSDNIRFDLAELIVETGIAGGGEVVSL